MAGSIKNLKGHKNKKMYLAYDPVITLLSIYPREIMAHVREEPGTGIFSKPGTGIVSKSEK